MDLTKLSDADLQALQAGDLSKVSDAGLSLLSPPPPRAPAEPVRPEVPYVRGPGPGGNAILGLMSAFSNVGLQGKRLGQRAIGDEEGVAATSKDIEAQRAADTVYSEGNVGFDLGRFGGDIAATAPAGGVAGKAVGFVGSKVLPKSLAWLARVGAEGGASSALTTGEAEDGAALAIGLGGLGKTVQRLSLGRKMTPEARRVVDAGVDLTPGQLNPRGMFAQAEAIATSLPAVGPLLRQGREAAAAEARTQAVKNIVPGAVGSKWDDALESAVGKLDDNYDTLRDYPIRGFTPAKAGMPDPKLVAGIQNALDDPSIMASPDARKAVALYATQQLQRLRTKRLTVGDYQAIRSDFRTRAERLSKGLTDDDRNKGLLFERAADVMTVPINRSLPMAGRKLLRETDRQYAGLRPYVKSEHSGAGTVEGPSFAQMEASIKRTMTPNQNARAVGRARRQFAQDARTVFDETRQPLTGARILGAPFAAALGPVALMGTTGIGRSLASGTTGPQRALRKVTDNDELNDILAFLRGGTAGALESQGNY
jgi:hypothetical protein